MTGAGTDGLVTAGSEGGATATDGAGGGATAVPCDDPSAGTAGRGGGRHRARRGGGTAGRRPPASASAYSSARCRALLGRSPADLARHAWITRSSAGGTTPEAPIAANDGASSVACASSTSIVSRPA